MNARNAGVAIGGCDWVAPVEVAWAVEIGSVGGLAIGGVCD